MRIISEFHDFYDIGQSFGQDGGLKYVRTKVEEDLGSTWPFPWMLSYDCRNFRIKSHVIGFCGKVYPFIEVVEMSVPRQRAFCYTLEEVDAFLVPLLKKKELVTYHDDGRWKAGLHRRSFKTYFEEVAQETDKHQQRFEKNLSPVFVSSLLNRAYSGYGISLVSSADPGQKIFIGFMILTWR